MRSYTFQLTIDNTDDYFYPPTPVNGWSYQELIEVLNYCKQIQKIPMINITDQEEADAVIDIVDKFKSVFVIRHNCGRLQKLEPDADA